MGVSMGCARSQEEIPPFRVHFTAQAPRQHGTTLLQSQHAQGTKLAGDLDKLAQERKRLNETRKPGNPCSVKKLRMKRIEVTPLQVASSEKTSKPIVHGRPPHIPAEPMSEWDLENGSGFLREGPSNRTL